MIDGLEFEGHIPIVDTKRVLAQHPKGVRGLGVAGIPLGAPGMEMPGAPPQSYQVIPFGAAGQRIYARHAG